ncbi:hypothetical protein CK203_114373 [Vitis vinifera]|uniref:Uncharacterized protein n=1 Tax=Vitis vinifera TaxID=29760 RepID=A0A438FEL2_VITVI|nr:hypothetical protein CK203_114373 [Vitis vinifera]
MLVKQYLCELKEAKEISSFRKDAIDEPSHQENLLKVNTSSGGTGLSS